MKQYTTAAPKVRRPLSDKQRACLPLLPIFNACKAKGLPTNEETKVARLYACNFYLASLPVDFIESFKDLLAAPWAIDVLASAVNDEVLTW
jgi:hypothetical protein